MWHLVLNILLWGFFVVALFTLFPISFTIWLVTFPFDPNRKALHRFDTFWASLYVWGNPFWTVSVTGQEHADRNKAYVIVSNHFSMADALVAYQSRLHFKWVGKQSMFWIPFVGWELWMNGHVPIKRGDPESRERCLARCRQWLRQGSSMLFFPEGTRSPDGKIRPFKTGAFRLALETGTDILPMVMHGTHDAVPKHSIFLSRKSHMSLEILPPISIKDYDRMRLEEEAARLAAFTFQTIQTKL